jgi:hypothetical protein
VGQHHAVAAADPGQLVVLDDDDRHAGDDEQHVWFS